MINFFKTAISSFVFILSTLSFSHATVVADNCNPVSEPAGLLVAFAALATFVVARHARKV